MTLTTFLALLIIVFLIAWSIYELTRKSWTWAILFLTLAFIVFTLYRGSI